MLLMGADLGAVALLVDALVVSLVVLLQKFVHRRAGP